MTTSEIAQLQQQQVYLTSAVRAMLEGHWCGEPPSVDAYVIALDPALEAAVYCEAPILESDVPPAPPEYLAAYDPNTSQPAQLYDWTCSVCSLDWLKRSLGMVGDSDVYASREQTTFEIGYPQNVNETYGLMDGSGAQLQRVLSDYGQPSHQGWLTFDQAYAIYAQTPGCMSGGAWYHWVGVRGTADGRLWIANSAEGYRGVYSTLDREQWNALGPFSCIWCIP